MGRKNSKKRERSKTWNPGDPLTKEDLKLLETVKETAQLLGRTPTKNDCSNVKQLKNRFRTWKNVIQAAQLPDLHSQAQVNIRDWERGEDFKLKIVVVAVSTSAIKELIRYYEGFVEKYGNSILDLKIHYIANVKADSSKRSQISHDIRTADAAIIDLMGSSARMIDTVSEALDSCKGQRIVIGNICRDKIRLGSFSMGNRKKEKKQQGTDVKEKDVVSMMNKMRRMAVAAGTILPVGITKDMKNIFLMIDYWQQAAQEDIASFMNLLLREYFGMKKLPKETPCTMRKGIFIKDPRTDQCYSTAKEYFHKKGYSDGKPVVAILFYGHNYPNYVAPIIGDAINRFERFSNVLPIAFSQNEDKDLEKLLEHLTSQNKIDMIVNFMPFRLGAGPMGGNAGRAVEILKEVNVPYLAPFYITKETRSVWESDFSGVNPGEFMISIMLPELDGATCTIPVGILNDASGNEIDEIGIIKERMESLCTRAQKLLRLRALQNKDKKIAIICYNYPPGEGNLFRASFLDVFGSVAVLWKELEREGYCTQPMTGEELRRYFFEEAMVNEARWSDSGKKMIRYQPEDYICPREVEQYWGKWPGKVMADENGIFIPGMISGNIFIGVQPSRSGGVDDEEGYHNKNVPPHHQYLGYYKWLRDEFQADAIIHVGTHGTLEFLPGKENGMTENCYPDMLTGMIPHFYYYYCGNPAEAMTAKRRTHATLLSYAPPAFSPGELYGDFQNLYEMIAEYTESLKLAPERSQGLKKNIRETAGKLGLPENIQELERELTRRKEALIPSGLHILGQPYSRQEAFDYGMQVMKFEQEEGEVSISEKTFSEYLETGKVRVQDRNEQEKLIKLLKDGKRAMEHAGRNEEISEMLRALKGEFISARSGGDVFRNSEQFPMGKNMVQFDPRLIPTRTAVKRGIQAAENTISRYKEQKGTYPRSTAVILWGLETSRSQGETIGQILAYLGIRMKSYKGSFETRFEIIPTEELKHPRMDVVIHICGFFRDMYPNIIENLNDIFRKLSQLEEPEEMNYFAGHSRKMKEALLAKGYSLEDAKELSICRIFGPAQSEYGTSLTDVIRRGNWTSEEELGDAFTESLCYVYTDHYKGKNFENLLEMNYHTVEFISQIRNNLEYELVDLDHYYEFYGGLSKSVERVKGQKAVMFVTDTTQNQVRTEDFKTAMKRGIYTRLLNPKWVEGMLKTPCHGVQKIADRFENVLGMAATTGEIDESVFHQMEERYVKDLSLQDRLRENNPYGYLTMLERLMEAHRRGYWKANEQELMEMRKAYLQTEGKIER